MQRAQGSGVGFSFLLRLILVFAATVSMVAGATAQQRRPALPLPPALKAPFLDMCGKADESKWVEGYDGSLEVTMAYVQLNSKSTLQLQWMSARDIQSRLVGYDIGNVADKRWCTGTLVAEDLVLTAGHCLDIQKGRNGSFTPFTRGGDGKLVFAEPPVLATLMQVNFGYTREDRLPDVFPIVRLEEWRLGPDKLDYAIVRIGRDAQGNLPSVKYHPIARVRIDDPKKGDKIAIIQHPHGDPMKVEAGRIFGGVGHELLYDDVDTFGGSSGSGIRDEDGVVVGVHTHGGCEEGVVVGDQEIKANIGVKNSSIAGVSKALRDLAKK